jgi:hypothetical protein
MAPPLRFGLCGFERNSHGCFGSLLLHCWRRVLSITVGEARPMPARVEKAPALIG